MHVCALHQMWDYDEQSVVVAVKHHHQSCQLNAKRASTPCISEAWVACQVRLTIKGGLLSFLPPFHVAYNQGRLTIGSIRYFAY